MPGKGKLTDPFKRMSIKLHPDDKRVLQKILIDDDLTFQAFMEACVQSYLRGDPNILKVVKDYKLISRLPKEKLAEYLLSHREREKLLRELEIDSPIKDDE
jgi:hypothetical protein